MHTLVWDMLGSACLHDTTRNDVEGCLGGFTGAEWRYKKSTRPIQIGV